jgi:phosphoglycolate phosphatase
MHPQLLIFDLDGTLVDSRADLAASINHMRSCFDLAPLPLETISSYIGSGVRDLVTRSLQGADVSLEEALELHKNYYDAHLVELTTTYPGVLEGVPALVGAGHQLALLTNKPGEPSRQILKHFGLDEYFTAIVGGGDVNRLKPAPDGVLACLAVSGLNASQAWMIGDHHTDMAVASHAGIRSAFAEYGFGDKRDYEADICCKSFAELFRFFS